MKDHYKKVEAAMLPVKIVETSGGIVTDVKIERIETGDSSGMHVEIDTRRPGIVPQGLRLGDWSKVENDEPIR